VKQVIGRSVVVFAVLCFLFSVVLAILKLIGIINWSWVWVFAHIWGLLAVLLAIAIIFTLVSWFVELAWALIEYISGIF
jgi:hypothetical protein